MTALVQYQVPLRLVPILMSQCFSVVAANGLGAGEPALLTSISIRPKLVMASLTILLTSSPLVISALSAMDFTPKASASAAVFLAPSMSISVTTTSQPSRAKAKAIPLKLDVLNVIIEEN